ncbi:Gfo/Idh/MocA family protein [Ruminiclostridium cellobioparum]|uniref:Gfo/Idh/MocA family protein n=1 Tax=Ruminiclostridium cellobioparum TaxID=29355 RepID=UPI000348189A|nr:Gfo/Idh/MocA family oxidoreductase [Ruminiclostridium cellobioparum]
MRVFKVGILGSGVISRTYLADIKAFYKNLEVIACADIDVELSQKLASEFGIRKAYTTEELLNDDEVEIVINLTPPQFHVELGKRIITAGKHLFSEKPFAPNLKAAKEVLDLAAAKGVKVGCAPDTFLASGLQSMRYYLDANLIGKPFFVTANMTTFGVETWHPNPAPFYTKYSGPLFDMGPYYLSAIVSLLGPIESIAALDAKGSDTRHIYVGREAGTDIEVEIPTHYSSILKLKSGVVVNFNVSFDIYRSNLPMFEIYGDGGTLTYPDPNFGGGTPRVYRKEQYTDTVYQKTDEAMARKDRFYELPELFPRVKDYSRGLGVLDLAKAIETNSNNRANGSLIMHITEAIEGMMLSSENGEFYKMITTCERPEPLKPGGYMDKV